MLRRRPPEPPAVPLHALPRPGGAARLRAANLIGDGLYGVDVKATADGAVVIEVNDNPNLDAGVEDAVLGEGLYRAILSEMLTRLERQRQFPQPGVRGNG